MLPGLFMIVLFSIVYALFYSFNCHIHELFWLIGFFVAFLDINNPTFRKTNSSGKTLDTRQKYFMQPWGGGRGGGVFGGKKGDRGLINGSLWSEMLYTGSGLLYTGISYLIFTILYEGRD